MKRNFYFGLFLGIFLTLLVISCAAKGPLSPENLNPEEQEEYKLLKKTGATPEELEVYILYHLTPALESERDSIWKEFWDRRYQALNAEEKAVYHSVLSDSSSQIKYLSLKDTKARRGFLKKIQHKKRDELLKTEEGKIFYHSFKVVASKEEIKTYLLLPDSLREEWLRIWWKKKDPDLTTEVNKFKEEFDQRVQHALIYYHTIFGQKPWDDRGDVYVLYGKPDVIEPADYYSDRHGNFEQVSSFGKKAFTLMDQKAEDMKSRSQVWVYFKHGQFQFQDYHATGHWELAPHKIYTSDKDSHEESVRALTQFLPTKTEKVETAKAEVEIDFGKPLNFAWDWWRFWNEGDTYGLRVNLGIPLEKLELYTDTLNPEMVWLTFEEKVIIHDAKSMRTVVQDSVTIRQKLAKNFNRENLLLVDQFSWDFLPPGNYVISVSVKDSVSQKIGIYDTTIILVPHVYATVQEKISRLVMADSIWVADSAYVTKNGYKFIRNSLVIMPHPQNVYLEGGSTPSYYCEVYGLKNKNDSSSAKIICNILSRTENDEFALYVRPDTVYANWPANSQPFLKGTLNLPEGEYIFHIIIYDLNDPEAKEEEVRETAVRFKVS